MALPKAISDAIGDIREVIKALAPDTNRLTEIYRQHSHPLSFINYYLRTFPESSRQWAGIIYRAIRYLANQGEVLAYQPVNTPIDRDIAGRVPVPENDPLKAYTYRYNLEIGINAPSQGAQHTFNFWVNSPYVLSPNEVLEIAIDNVIKVMNKYNLTLQSGFPNSATMTSSEIKGFVMYDPGVRN